MTARNEDAAGCDTVTDGSIVDPAVVRIGGEPERAADAPATWTQRLSSIAKTLSECEL